MRGGRGIAVLGAAVQRRARPSAASAVPHVVVWAPPTTSSPSPSSSSSSSPSFASTREGQDRRAGGGGRGGPWLAAAGAFSTSFALSSMAAAAAKERGLAADGMPGEVVLYQYEVCPFCNKVKAFLDYNNVPYQVVEVNPIGKKELKWSDYKKVPILMVDGVQLNDSTGIMTTLNKQLRKGQPFKEADNSEEEQWRRWVDDHLVHLLSPNIYRTPTEAFEAFAYVTENGNFTPMERTSAKYFGAAAMYFIAKRLKKRHNIDDERTSLYEAAETWVRALNGRKFMGGEKPNLADLAVFGVLRPIRHMQAGEDMAANTSIGTWYHNMEEAVGPSSRLPTKLQTSELGKPVHSTIAS